MKHELRNNVTGQYRATQPCDACGKPTGAEYFTDPDVCGGTDGPGFFLCGRTRCAARYEGQTVEFRRALFAAQRERNDAARRSGG